MRPLHALLMIVSMALCTPCQTEPPVPEVTGLCRIAGGLGGFLQLADGTRTDVRLVLGAYRGYLAATSPRLRSAGTIMDAGRSGSRTFDISDAQNRVLTVRFDHAAGTTTPGRLREDWGRDEKLVDLGSEREAELLGMLRRTAELRRAWLGADADVETDTRLRMLETELDGYRAMFLDAKAGK